MMVLTLSTILSQRNTCIKRGIFFIQIDFRKDNLLQDGVGILIFSRNEHGDLRVTNAKDQSWGLLPWSPSWSEINYFAYGLPTIEFHNELYGYVQEKSEKHTILAFEEYLKSNNIDTSKNGIQKGMVFFKGKLMLPYILL
jgi:hypothetical protein